MQDNRDFRLDDGSSVAVIGGGPAGSFFSYFLRTFAGRVGREIQVDIYEPRDFFVTGPGGCNMCGGIISESLVQHLALEGIDLPESLVQRGIDSYVLHTMDRPCPIETPLDEKRIAAVHRGAGPRTIRESKWQGFDAFLLKNAIAGGANFYHARVSGLTRNGGKIEVTVPGQDPKPYDLVVGAVGINSTALSLFEALGFQYRRPKFVRTFITELQFGSQQVRRLFGSSMHVFLLDLPRLDFAALIPKGDFVTLCLLGKDIDKDLVKSFFGHPAVKRCFPENWEPPLDCCHCAPKMFFGDARHPFADRVVLIGDSGIARLYKDGIGAAYRTSKAAARTAVFEGVSERAFRKHYYQECRNLSRDNLFGRAIFLVVHLIRHLPITSRSVLKVVERERALRGKDRLMSTVLWDTFTGSAPYRDIFIRTLHPIFLIRFLLAHFGSLGKAAGAGSGSSSVSARKD